MKTILSVLSITALTLWGANLKADDATTGTLQTSVLSKYVDTDGQVYYGKSVIQTELTQSVGKSGLYVDLWDSQALNGRKSYGDEVEYSLGWTHDLGVVNVDAGVSYYDIIPLFKGPAGDVYVVYARFSKAFDKGDKSIFTPFLALNSYTTGRGSNYEGGARAQGGLTYSKAIGKVTVEETSALTKDGGTYGAPPAWVGSQSADLSFAWGKVSIKLPVVTAYAPLSGHSARHSSVVYGANVSYGF